MTILHADLVLENERLEKRVSNSVENACIRNRKATAEQVAKSDKEIYKDLAVDHIYVYPLRLKHAVRESLTLVRSLYIFNLTNNQFDMWVD